MKLRCSSHEPCKRCYARSFTCKYTRAGYLDPYEGYRVGPERRFDESTDALEKSQSSTLARSELDNTIPIQRSSSGSEAQSADSSNGTLDDIDLSGSNPGAADLLLLPCSQMAHANPICEQDVTDFLNMDFSPMDFEFAPSFTFPFGRALETNLLSLSLDSTENSEPTIWPNAPCIVEEGTTFIDRLS